MSLISTVTTAVKTLASSTVSVVTKYDPIKDASQLNFSTGEILAPLQDGYISILNRNFNAKISNAQLNNLIYDIWVPLAARLAPNNLVIRQYCLIDIFSNNIKNYSMILNQMNKISYKTDVTIPKFSGSGTQLARIWGEGYSYFEYTMNAVRIWINKFMYSYPVQTATIQTLANKIYAGFVATSYKRGNLWYPVTLGDLWPISLTSNPVQNQIDHTPINGLVIGPVKMNVSNGVVTSYNITAKPLGCNLHTSVNNYNTNIVSGLPTNFAFYQGYGKKYPTKAKEIVDMLNPLRLLSIVSL